MNRAARPETLNISMPNFPRASAYLEKLAFDPITFTLGLLAAHVGGNVALKAALKSGPGKRALARFVQTNAELAAKGRSVHPSIKGASDVLLGPEIAELGHLGAFARKNVPAPLQGAAANFMGEATKSQAPTRLSKFLERTSVPESAGKGNKLRYAAGFGAALPSTLIPGAGHFTLWNALKTAFFNNPIAKRMELTRRIGASTAKQGLADTGLKAKAKSLVYNYGASPIQGELYDSARRAQGHLTPAQLAGAQDLLTQVGAKVRPTSLKLPTQLLTELRPV